MNDEYPMTKDCPECEGIMEFIGRFRGEAFQCRDCQAIQEILPEKAA